MTDNLVRIAEMLEDNASRVVSTVHRQIMISNAAVVRDAKARIEALTAQLESTLRDRKLILEERDRTFALMLARAEAAEADNARLRDVVLEADKLLCGDLTGLQWKRECRSFLVWARAVLKGESHD
jgi:hypothetical protein